MMQLQFAPTILLAPRAAATPIHCHYQQWQFDSNAETFGVYEAARFARRSGVTLAQCLQFLRAYRFSC